MKKRLLAMICCMCLLVQPMAVSAADVDNGTVIVDGENEDGTNEHDENGNSGNVGDGDFSYIEGSETARTAETNCQVTVITECPEGFGLNTCVDLSGEDGKMYRISLSQENGYTDQIYLKPGEYKVLSAKMFGDNTGRYPFVLTEGDEKLRLDDSGAAEIRFRLRDYDSIMAAIEAEGSEEKKKQESISEARYDTAIEGITMSGIGDLYYPVLSSGSGIGEMTLFGNARGNYDLRVEIIKSGVIGEAQFSLSLDGGETLVGDDVTAERFELKDYGLVLAFSTENDTDELQKGDVFTATVPETFAVMTSKYGEANVVLVGSPQGDYDLVVDILSSGGRGEAKFTVSLDAGNSTFATDTIPEDGIYELTDGMRLCFSDSDSNVKGTEYTAEIRSNVEEVSMVPLYVLLGMVVVAAVAIYVGLLAKKEQPGDYMIHTWHDQQEPEKYV